MGRSHARVGKNCEEEEVAERSCNGLITNPHSPMLPDGGEAEKLGMNE